MSKVRTSAYRQTPTPGGLKAIEEGTLDYFDTEMYANFNTEVLEEYLEEKNRKDGFGTTKWKWNQMLLGLVIGIIFAIINQYVGLKVGMIVSGSWYVAYLSAMALRWSPGEVNLSASASTGASMVCTGFVFTYPAIYLLAYSPNYALADKSHLIDSSLLLPDSWALAGVAMVASILGGFLGCLYFIIFRRVWLVEDPLPLPGFEANIKLMDIAGETSKKGGMEGAMHSIRLVGFSTAIVMFFTFLRDWPLLGSGPAEERTSVLGGASENISWYNGASIQVPTDNSISNYTLLGFELTPMMLAIGWFMKTRVALLVNLGTLVGWLFLVPLAVFLNVPVYEAQIGASVPVQDYHSVMHAFDPSNYPSPTGAAQMIIFSKTVRTIAIGSIVGGGMFGLAKMYKTFLNIFGDIGSALKGEGSQEYMEGKGWYEWPLKHIPIFMIVTFFSMILIFTLGGFSILASFIFATVLIMTTFLLGAIAVRVMGETGIEPVSGTSFIVLLMLLGVFLNAQELLDLNTQDAVLLGLVGTTVFGSAISMSGTVIGDYKNSLYIGNRPYHISKGNIMGVVPGAIIGAGVAIFLSIQLANGTIDLIAPQANAFATFSVIFAEGQGDLNLLALGFLLGMFVEWATGMGTSFGLGMYLDVPHTLPMLIGGYARDKWEDKNLKPRIEKIKAESGTTEAEKQRALILLGTFMVAAGLLTGEAFFGTESSILSFIDTMVPNPSSIYWYFGRLFGFVVLNLAIGYGIYALFKRAGIIGAASQDAVLDAEKA